MVPRSVLRVLLAGAVLLGAACSDDPVSPPESFVLSVRVTDSSGSPLEGYRVSAWNTVPWWAVPDCGTPGRAPATEAAPGATPAAMQAASPSAHPAQLVNRLDGSAPNPLSPHGVLRFSLAEPCSASLRVQDLDGQPVRSLVDGASAAGAHQVAWDGRDDAGDVLPPSVYLARLEVWTLDRTVLAFADSTWFGIFTPDPDDEATWLGFTGADGRVTSTDRARFPCLYSHPPLIARTEEGVELGTFLYTDTLAIVVQDTVSGEFRTSRQFLGPGANRFEIRF